MSEWNLRVWVRFYPKVITEMKTFGPHVLATDWRPPKVGWSQGGQHQHDHDCLGLRQADGPLRRAEHGEWVRVQEVWERFIRLHDDRAWARVWDRLPDPRRHPSITTMLTRTWPGTACTETLHAYKDVSWLQKITKEFWKLQKGNF